MGKSDEEVASRLEQKFDEVEELQLEALRRAGVAEQKRKGLKIESTESVRLLRQGTGYLLRLQNLADKLEEELDEGVSDNLDVVRILGYTDDYNRIRSDLKENPRFAASIESFPRINNEYSRSGDELEYKVDIGGYKYGVGKENSDTTNPIEKAILPKMIRLTEDMRDSLIGRIMSGK